MNGRLLNTRGNLFFYKLIRNITFVVRVKRIVAVPVLCNLIGAGNRITVQYRKMHLAFWGFSNYRVRVISQGVLDRYFLCLFGLPLFTLSVIFISNRSFIVTIFWWGNFKENSIGASFR